MDRLDAERTTINLVEANKSVLFLKYAVFLQWTDWRCPRKLAETFFAGKKDFTGTLPLADDISCHLDGVRAAGKMHGRGNCTGLLHPYGMG